MSLVGLGLTIYAVCSLLSMATMSIGAAVLGGLFALSLGGKKLDLHESVLRNYLIISLGAVGACVLSLIVGRIFPLSFDGRIPSIHLFFDSAKLWYFFWPILIVLALEKINDHERLTVLKAWLITFIILSALGILQHFIGWPRPQVIPEDPTHFHATLFLGHHLSVASIFIFPFFVLLDFLRESLVNGKKSLLPQRVLIAGAVVGFLCLMLTYSRTLWVALPIGIVIWVMSYLPRKQQILAVGAAVVMAALVIQIPAVQTRLLAPIGVHTREDLWEANFEMFKDRPLTGVGLKHNQELSGFYLMAKYHTADVFSGHAHNNILDLLGGTGLIGLIACGAWFVFIFLMVMRSGVHVAGYDLSSGILCALIVFQLNGLTQVNFWEAKVQHQLMWIVGWILFGAIGA